MVLEEQIQKMNEKIQGMNAQQLEKIQQIKTMEKWEIDLNIRTQRLKEKLDNYQKKVDRVKKSLSERGLGGSPAKNPTDFGEIRGFGEEMDGDASEIQNSEVIDQLIK